MSRTILGLLVLAALLGGCTRKLDRQLVEIGELSHLDKRSPYLKVHMLDGSLYVLSHWEVFEEQRTIHGRGKVLDQNRQVFDEAEWTIPLRKVAILETNVVQKKILGSLVVPMAVTVGVTIACALNPKSCFGSCPTFYTEQDGREILHSEGFSASVAPSLEASDIDALWRIRPEPGILRLTMRNEAVETHVVRSVRLLGLPRPMGQTVYAVDDGSFYAAKPGPNLVACRGAEGNCLPATRAVDDLERFSTTDSTNLAAKEIIELEFETGELNPQGRLGLVITSRQTLLTTFLLYQTLAYMGTQVSEYIAKLERATPAQRGWVRSPGRLLGGIDVLLPDADGGWRMVGTTSETGPLASDRRMVVLPEGATASRVRLRLTRGHWRIDSVQLVEVVGEVEPLVLEVSAVATRDMDENEAMAALLDPELHLVTYPGEAYELMYDMPEDAGRRDWFLQARGYYLEWMREEWLAEESPSKAMKMFLDPAGSLRELAPVFKAMEADMEAQFWGSRYAH